MAIIGIIGAMNSEVVTYCEDLCAEKTNIEGIYKANAYGEIPAEKQLREYGAQTETLRREADTIWRLIRQSISRQRHTEL